LGYIVHVSRPSYRIISSHVVRAARTIGATSKDCASDVTIKNIMPTARSIGGKKSFEKEFKTGEANKREIISLIKAEIF